MSEKIIILTEEPLAPINADNIIELYDPAEEVSLEVLVAGDTKRNLFVDVIDQLTLLDIPAAVKEITERPSAAQEAATAEEILKSSLQLLTDRGAHVSGRVVEGNAVDALVRAVREVNARQAVVVTSPHAIEDTFRQDWASQAQRKLDLPVLHLYAGTGFIGDS